MANLFVQQGSMYQVNGRHSFKGCIGSSPVMLTGRARKGWSKTAPQAPKVQVRCSSTRSPIGSTGILYKAGCFVLGIRGPPSDSLQTRKQNHATSVYVMFDSLTHRPNLTPWVTPSQQCCRDHATLLIVAPHNICLLLQVTQPVLWELCCCVTSSLCID